MAIAVAFTAVAYGQAYVATLADAVAGARTPLLVTLPVLVVLIAAGYRTPPRGVGDTESNWIIAVMVTAPALAGFELLAHRLPTLSALSHLKDLGAIVWFAALLAVLFGVRHVVRMWPLWIFTVCCAGPLPSILVTAALGGSDAAALMPTVIAGAVAVFLAGPAVPRWRRAVAAAACFAISGVLAAAAASHLPLIATALAIGGALPVIVTLLNRRTVAPADTPPWSAPHPVSTRSVTTLAAVAVVLAVLNPATVRPAPLPTAGTGWIDAAGLTRAADYDFITRYAGPEAAFVRYRPATASGLSAPAVDVITTPNRATLEAIGDLTWYPAALPVNYRPAPPGSDLPEGARIGHTDADAARSGDTGDWLAITWEWRAGNVFQRVTVISDQSPRAGHLPEPSPVNLLDVSLRPALWVARQQPDATGPVEGRALARATALAAGLRAAAVAHPADGTATDA